MNVTIIGLGLIGGSLGLALRATCSDVVISGWDQSVAVMADAQQRGAITHVPQSLAEAVGSAELVIVATPIMAVRHVFALIAPHLRPNTLVTDVASTKAQIMTWAEDLLPTEVVFVGGHPMAGSERHGIVAARADLLRGATYCLTPSSATPERSMLLLEQLVIAAGAQPLIIDAATHDAYVAAVSHLPFLLSAALIQQTASDDTWPNMSRIAATGFRDVTRLASGDPSMHRDICLTNAQAIQQELRAMSQRLADLAARLDDPSLLDTLFNDAKQQRDDWLRQRSGGQ